MNQHNLDRYNWLFVNQGDGTGIMVSEHESPDDFGTVQDDSGVHWYILVEEYDEIEPDFWAVREERSYESLSELKMDDLSLFMYEYQDGDEIEMQ